ncbi:hypothetical protein KXQ82_00800 [Mucilaginibacter sp. HMF5004]|uniref:hypothetical protein n=1 Tax=Mucilaginibacter rivuli TaxID=2857527 RepID=UPI001C5D37FE|nr:hypothetical protein [Mucilaginibacter rivuli]MBW4888226.1 hypothetical protein [Mucilaginibacter rivuli]
MPMPVNIRSFITKHLDSLIAAIAGFFVVNIFTRYAGVGISPDSIMYLSTARNLNAHHGLIFFSGKPIVAFPVFFPIFLAIVQFITHTDVLALASTLTGLMFASVIFLSGVVMEGFTYPSKLYKWFILIALVLSPSLLEIYSMLWSETLFMVLMLLFFIAYKNYLDTHSIKALLWVSAIAAIACITRYAAITLVLTGGLLLLCDKQLNIRKKISHIFLFGGISVSLLIVNIIRNSLVTHTGTGPRYKSVTSLSQNMHYTGTVFCDWFTLTEKQYGWAIIITALLVLAFSGIFLYNTLVRKARFTTYENIIITYFIACSLFMILWATVNKFETLNNRLLSALFIPFLLGCTYWLPMVLKYSRSRFRLIAITLATCVGLIFIYNEYNIDYQRYYDQGDYGVPGFTDDSWNKSPLVATLKKPNLFKAGYPIYNNLCEGFYFFTGKGSEYIPNIDSAKQIKKFYAQKHFYIVYFDQLPDKALFTLKQVQQQRPLKTIFQCPDGGIYEYNEKKK